jgi:ArsR family metal-binding transcriptional regulator
MSAGGQFSSVDDLMSALADYVRSKEDFTTVENGFAVQVFIGRGVVHFQLCDELDAAKSNLEQLEMQLSEAKKKMNAALAAASEGSKKRQRTTPVDETPPAN